LILRKLHFYNSKFSSIRERMPVNGDENNKGEKEREQKKKRAR
jgi:hypothetical protein